MKDVTLTIDSAYYALGWGFLHSPINFDNAELTLRGASGVWDGGDKVTFNGYAPENPRFR